MRAPPSLGATNLATVEDRSVNSDEKSQNFDPSPTTFDPATPSTQPRMKRSPYLSVMAGSTKESEDLVAMLSRPTGSGEGFGGGLRRSGQHGHHHGHHDHDEGHHHHHHEGREGGGTHSHGSGLASHGHDSQGGGSQSNLGHPSPGGGGGRSSFFDLKRPSSAIPMSMGGMMMGGDGTMDTNMMTTGDSPSHTVTPVSSAGGEFSDNQDESAEGGSSQGNSNSQNANEQPPRHASDSNTTSVPTFSTSQQPQQRPLPSLRSALRMGSRSDMKALQSSSTGMKKNTSVTFSTATKKASVFGMVEASQQGGNAGFAHFQDTQTATQQGSGGMAGGHAPTRVGFAQVAQMRNFSQQSSSSSSSQGAAGGYTAEMMMKKSMSIAAPQFLLAHQNSVNSSSEAGGSSANASFSTQGTQPTNNSSSAMGGGSGGGGQGGGAGGNASFPIYFSKLPEDQQNQQQQQQGQYQAPPYSQQQQGGIPTTNKPASPPQHARQRSKSMSTLRYYAAGAQAAANLQGNITKDPAQKLLHAAGMTGIAPVARPSINGLNLTFRDMLDEGDGAEGDLNLRLRNQQWKDFRTFSSKFEESNPMMVQAQMMEVDEENEDNASEGDKCSPIKEGGSVGSTSTTTATTNASGAHGIPLSGSKRTLTPSSLNSRTSNTSTVTSNRGNSAMANPNVPPLGRSLAGSHRATVSVNDLAVLRRAAARMKMSGPAGGGMMMGGQQQQRRTSQKMSGEILGGDMLSRIPSVSTASSSNNGNGGGGEEFNQGLSPLAQMMAKKNAMNRTPSQSGMSGSGMGNTATGGGGMGSRSGSFANPQQKELFMQKFNMAMNQHYNNVGMGGGLGAQGGQAAGGMGTGGPNPALSQPFGQHPHTSMSNLGMGRRSRTVGAGLAYGRANMTTDFKSGFRMSKFNLGDLRKESSRLSEISSAGSSTAGGGGRNEEWDLS